MDIIYPIYTEQNYLNVITLISIVKSLLHCNPPNIWINIIQITIQIKFLHGTTFVQTGYYIKIIKNAWFTSPFLPKLMVRASVSRTQVM